VLFFLRSPRPRSEFPVAFHLPLLGFYLRLISSARSGLQSVFGCHQVLSFEARIFVRRRRRAPGFGRDSTLVSLSPVRSGHFLLTIQAGQLVIPVVKPPWPHVASLRCSAWCRSILACPPRSAQGACFIGFVCAARFFGFSHYQCSRLAVCVSRD
jgi:hypothetical protein